MSMMTLNKETMQHINDLLQQERDRIKECIPDTVTMSVPYSHSREDEEETKKVLTPVPDFVKAEYLDGIEELALFSDYDLIPSKRSSAKNPLMIDDYFDIEAGDASLLERSDEWTPQVQQAYQRIIDDLHVYVMESYGSKSQIQDWLDKHDDMQEKAYDLIDTPYEAETEEDYDYIA